MTHVVMICYRTVIIILLRCVTAALHLKFIQRFSDLKCYNKLRYDTVDIHTREINIMVTILIYYSITCTFIF